ncbi:hypothetical protein RXV86_07125 [Alisedimentitalea sp. MJ-SS2]|uniref:hypothetical protein n=1 Tax=Aliisedimentitalea sp. MJ-SS2 TaxID=3049795 RepID=UPI002914AF73|nr:hypothetical protein [Alisedimentitalea sp. MJ-SS2]MDU8927151.1 hypothetical protein [Alisedimentitalea sp. MJ-SS2]
MALTLTIIHFIAFSFGIGGGITNMIIGKRIGQADEALQRNLAGIADMIGRLVAIAVLLLWLTGIALVYLSWGGWSGLPSLFWVKVAAVLVLSVCLILIKRTVAQANRSGSAPDEARIAPLSLMANLSGLIALVLALVSFSG